MSDIKHNLVVMKSERLADGTMSCPATVVVIEYPKLVNIDMIMCALHEDHKEWTDVKIIAMDCKANAFIEEQTKNYPDGSVVYEKHFVPVLPLEDTKVDSGTSTE